VAILLLSMISTDRWRYQGVDISSRATWALEMFSS